MLWTTALMCKDMWCVLRSLLFLYIAETSLHRRRRLEIARSMHGLSFNARLGKLTHLVVDSAVPYVLFWVRRPSFPLSF